MENLLQQIKTLAATIATEEVELSARLDKSMAEPTNTNAKLWAKSQWEFVRSLKEKSNTLIFSLPKRG